MANFHDVWVIAPEEKIKHDNQFYLMNPTAGFLSGEQVKVFFLQSGLPQSVLGKIWQLSDINADGKMDKMEFSIAMHLIKKALQGYDIPHILPPSLLANVPMGSTFNPVMNSGMMGPAFGVAPNPNILYNTATLPFPGASAALVSADPRNFATISKPPITTTAVSGEWSITPAQRLKYKQFFNNHDVSHKGYLTGLEAKGVLSQSGLTHPVLAQIWSLADIDTDGNLSPDEFCVAMFLIDQAKSGFPIPPMLPPDLVPPSYRKGRRPSEPVGMNVSVNLQSSLSGTCKPGVCNDTSPNASMGSTNLNMSGSETNSSNFLDSEPARIITFEDKRKENFDKGQAELERRRAMLRDQQLQESEDRLAAERAEQEKREKIRQDQEMKRQIEQEKQLERQRQIEMEKEEQRRKLLEQKEAARKELERQRQLEWEKQRRDQLVADKSREENLVDDLKQETGQQKLLFESLQSKKTELLNKIEQTKFNISELSNFIQSLKHSSLSKTTEIDVLKAELEEVEMKLVAAQQESLRLGRQINTPDSLADQGLCNLIKDHSKTKERLEELKKKIEIIETTCKNKKALISQLETKLEEVKQICEVKQDKNISEATQMSRNFDSKFPAECEKNGNEWDFNAVQNDSTSLFDSAVNWPTAFAADTEFQDNKSDSDAWATFGASEQTQSNQWTADFNSLSNVSPSQTEDEPTKYRALYRFDAKNSDELSLAEGDVVLVCSKDQSRAEPGWMIGSLNGKEGCFPQAYVELITLEDAFSVGAKDFNSKSEATCADPATETRIEVTPALEPTSSERVSLHTSSLLKDKKDVKVQAIYPWQAKKDNHLSFQKGDIIVLISKQEMWWFGELNGKVGWFPKSYVKVFGEPEMAYSPTPPEVSMDLSSVKQPILPHDTKPSDTSQNNKKLNLEEFIVVAMFTYSSNVPGDLTFNQGDVFPAQKTDDEWWTGTLNGSTGIFPASYVQQMETLNATKLQENRKPEIASVIAAYPATGPEQLTLQPGQLIHVRKKSPSGWWEGELQVKGQKRRIGWFPANYVKMLGMSNSNTPEPDAQEHGKNDNEGTTYLGQAMALYTYMGQTGEDLSFQEGAIISLLEKASTDWWKGELNGCIGIFPANYVTLLPSKSSNNSSLNALSCEMMKD